MLKLKINNKYRHNQKLSLNFTVKTEESKMFVGFFFFLKHVEDSKIQMDYWRESTDHVYNKRKIKK